VKSNCDERRRFSEKYTNDEVLATVGKHKPTGTMKIAEELGIKRPN
jgi:predicted transcriptional regulator